MPTITLPDVSLKQHTLTPRVAALKEAYFRAIPEICTERATLVTRGSRAAKLFDKKRITPLEKARLYRYVLEQRQPVVRHETAVAAGMTPFAVVGRSLFAGSTTSKFKGVPLYPEFMALALWPELQTITARKSNPYCITDDEVRILNEDVFPYWLDCNINELGRAKATASYHAATGRGGDAPEVKLLEYLVFFITSKPNCISHTIPDFSRALKLGLRGLIAEA